MHRPGPLDALVADIVGRCGYDFTIAADAAAREAAYALRYRAVIEQGWANESDLPDGRECDAYDDHAVHILCWDEGAPVATGRLVLPGKLPPGQGLPTEQACGLLVQPPGQVVDVGRMSVARSHQTHRHSVFIGLLARLYMEVQRQGYDVACGIMSARTRSMMRLLGLQLEVLGPERLHWGEPRAPVRFSLSDDAAV
jgi:N-acyl-L-homoserine lactone synthetase